MYRRLWKRWYIILNVIKIYPEETHNSFTIEFLCEQNIDYKADDYNTNAEKKDMEWNMEFYYINKKTNERIKECNDSNFFNEICGIRINENNKR